MRRPTLRQSAYGAFPIVVLSLISLVDASTKGVLAVALQDIQDELAISDSQAGLLPVAEVLAGALIAAPAGLLADRRARTKILRVLLPVWSGLSALVGAAQGFLALFGLRAALGAMTTVDDPASSGLISDYYEPRLRAKAFAARSVSPSIGAGFGSVIAGLLVAGLGWRWAFVLGGVPAALVTFLVLRLREPVRGGSDPVVAQALAEEPLAAAGVVDTGAVRRAAAHADGRSTWSGLLRIRSLVLILVGQAIAQGIAAAAAFWGPTYFQRHHDLGPASAAAIFGFSLLIGGVAGALSGGVLATRFRRIRHVNVKIGGYGNILGALLLLLVFVPLPLAIKPLFLALGMGSILAGAPPLAAEVSEVVPAASRGSAYAAQVTSRLAFAAALPFLVGIIADQVDHVVRDVPVAQSSDDFEQQFLEDREDRFECVDGVVEPVDPDGQSLDLAAHYACEDVVRGHVGIGLLAILVLAPIGGVVILAARRTLDDDIEAARSSA